MSKAAAHPNDAHKYLRIRVKGRNSVTRYRFRCVRPGCSHYVLEDFIVGAVCECWRCGQDFIIDRTTALKKPHCRGCTRKKNFSEDDLEPIPESPI